MSIEFIFPAVLLVLWLAVPVLFVLCLAWLIRRRNKASRPRQPLRLSLPLLAKELLEQAARKRTYVVRVMYACLLFFASFLFFNETLSVAGSSPFAALGRGRQMFDVLVGLQFAGIYFFMPAITCSVLTIEKERNTLHLLLLTKLGPWAILFEKLLSRLIPMFTFLLLSLPLLAFAYSLGGISPEYLVGGVWFLLITVLQVGTLALACSAFYRTTVGAFIGTYLLGILFYFGPPVLYAMTHAGEGFRSTGPLEDLLVQAGILPSPGIVPFACFGPMMFFANGIGVATPSALPPVVARMLCGVPILASAGGFLLLARYFILRRAFVEPRNALLNVFRKLDGLFSRMNQNRVTRGIVLVGDRAHLPEDEPVAWRETTKKSLGTARYLFRVFVALEIPTGVVCLLLATAGEHDSSIGAASAFLFLLWGVAALLVAVTSASLISGERSHQTLDVLCTTPLSGRAIIEQKMRSVRRLIWILCVPFLTIFLFEIWWKSSVTDYRYQFDGRRFSVVLYLTCSLLSLAIYLPLVAWLSLLIGLNVKSHSRAIIGSLAAIVGWCVIPLLLIAMPLAIASGPGTFDRSGLIFSVLLSPAAIIPFNEFGELREFAQLPWLAVFLNFMGYGFCRFVLKNLCLLNVDSYLGRMQNFWEDRYRSALISPRVSAGVTGPLLVENAVPAVGGGEES